MFIPFISGIGQMALNALEGIAAPVEAALGLQPPGQSQTTSSTPAPTQGGHHGLMSKIESAVIQALQSSPASSTSNPNQVIQNAISQVLDGTNSTQSTTNTDDDSLQSTFLQTLQQYGVDPQQFRQDLLTAMQNSAGGTMTPGNASQYFPAGSLLNTMG